ncbi:MAG: HAD hydrolase-like protein [Chloroflexi bacterium]|nr:HAD hydrolase-like protein [Chloroflexota bacterium]
MQTAPADVVVHFQLVLGRETAVKTAPDSPLYKRCLAELGFQANEVLVIEDSEPGFQAAKTAQLPCAVIYNDYTLRDSFAGAQLVARSLELFILEQLAALCLPE